MEARKDQVERLGASSQDVAADMALIFSRVAILVVDVVESVRLMQRREAETVRQWTQLVRAVRADVLPVSRGQLVKSTGDGLLLRFDTVPDALEAARGIQALLARSNAGHGGDDAMALRMAIHSTEAFVDSIDMYGDGVNLACRLLTLALPGDIVVSGAARDQLTDHVHSELVDLGRCFLKHFDEPVRAYRIASRSGSIEPAAPAEFRDHLPSIAVVPLSCMDEDPSAAALGAAIADDVISALSRTGSLRVISRLSTAAFQHRSQEPGELRRFLGVTYALGGRFSMRGDRIEARIELCDLRSGIVVWADVLGASVRDLFHGQDAMVPMIVERVGREVLRCEMERVRTLPIASLETYSLFLAAVAMVHRVERRDFDFALRLIERLIELQPRSSVPRTLLARWHVFAFVQRWAADGERCAAAAYDSAQRALDLDPDDAEAMAMRSAAIGFRGGDVHEAIRSSEAATRANPQQPDGWLTLGGMHSYLGNPEPAESSCLQACALSPLDPARYLFDLHVAASKVAAGKYEEAAEAARSSIRLNALHPPSRRHLVIALALDGRVDEARLAAIEMLRLDPSFRVAAYMARYPGRGLPHARLVERALLEAELPR
jgi:class 3 adenylate cyclase